MHQVPMDLTMTHLLVHGNEEFPTAGTMYPHSSYDLSSAQDDGCKLVLGLGPTPTSYCADFPSGLTKSKESVSMFTGPDSGMLQLGLGTPMSDEGSTSSKRESGSYMPSLLFAPRGDESMSLGAFSDQLSPEPSATTDSSVGVTFSGQHRAQHHAHPKKCRFKGCSKGARGASGLCIGHGGGQRCQKPGCNKGAESRTAYCKAHGGGRRCHHLGCTKSAEGKTDYCIAHGGGRRCNQPDCTKAARGKSGLCIRHGGGKRCSIEGCTRSAEGHAGLCISHGGGRRCQFPGCNKGAQGSTMHCKAHGGGKRCIFTGCNKGAEGSTPYCKGHGGGKRCLFEGGGICPKSVHGGTDYCVAHGGGKRCSIPGCTKSARGRTDCCVRHGGGKRCQSEGCGKSAQGSTDYCKAHGGGKRCGWGGGCEKFARGRSGMCAAHAKEGGVICSGLFRGIVTSTSTADSSGVSAVSDCAQSGLGQGFIPAQVLVPVEMKADAAARGRFVIPEGRVHGGALMSLLGGSIRNVMNMDQMRR